MLDTTRRIWNGIKGVWTGLKSPPDQIGLLTTYLAGPMEYTPDNGLDWRVDFSKSLEQLNIKSVIPNFEEAELVPDVKEFDRDKEHNLPKYVDTMRKIIRKDLEFVETVDFIITKWEGERMSGTVGEAQHAFLIDQPNYLVTSKPFHEVPGWFLACFTKMFHTKEELLEFLREEYNR